MRHTRAIAAQGSPQQGRDLRAERGQSEQVTGSIERVSTGGPGQDALIARVRDAAFPVALRGYEREAVDAYVKHVQRLVTDLEASRSPEAAIRRALDQVGEETSSILQRAQQTANEITERSRASADDRVREAEREARALLEDAEDRVRELEADYGEIWARRDQLLDEVRDLAERLLATSDDAAERFRTQQDEVAAETTGSDTASFPQLEAAAEDTTGESPFAVGDGADFEEVTEGSSAPADTAPGEPPAYDLERAGEPAGEDETVSISTSSASPELEEADERRGEPMSPGDEIDFADSPDDEDEDRDLEQRSADEPRSP